MNPRDLISRKSMLLALLAASLLAALALGLWPTTTSQEAIHPAMVSPKMEGAYTGSLACKECHEEVYNGWRSTFHPIKFQRTTPEFVIGDFHKNNQISSNGVKLTMTRLGREFQVNIEETDKAPVSYPIHYVLGSIWKQRYITELPKGVLAVLPWCGMSKKPGGKSPIPEI